MKVGDYVIDTYGDRKLVDVDLLQIVGIYPELDRKQLECKILRSKLANINNDTSEYRNVSRDIDDDDLMVFNKS